MRAEDQDGRPLTTHHSPLTVDADADADADGAAHLRVTGTARIPRQ